jgi:hypothetical protein
MEVERRKDHWKPSCSYVARKRYSNAYKEIAFDRLICLPFYLQVAQLQIIDHNSEIIETVFEKHKSSKYKLFDDWTRYLRNITNKEHKAQALLGMLPTIVDTEYTNIEKKVQYISQGNGRHPF